jgi:MtrB/PioB family decaheme-associated outer membrane protein
MNTRNEKIRVSILALAVQAALITMFALPAGADDAANAEAESLKRPTNYVEIGAMNVVHDSAKFGEYNGLNDSGVYAIGNFDVRGGDAYDEGEGTMRYEAKGINLGTTSRTLGASAENQGKWKAGVGYDELRHYLSDSYQTPQQGSMGGNNFKFPANFGTINGNAAPSARVLNATQLGAFDQKDVYTERKNSSFSAGYTFTPQLSLDFDFNHLDQDGAKLLGTSSLGGVRIPGAGANLWRAEGVNIIMNPTNYKTDTVNLALNWVGDKGHLTAGYFGSFFSDGYDSVSSQNAFRQQAGGACASGGSCTYQTTVMSTAPDNSLNQFNLTGGYAFSPATKLAGGFSYGRNTQDNSYISGQPEIVSAPNSSLDGKVITTHADLKLTHQAMKDLMLTAGFKYNERDNQSDSDMYRYYAINNISVVDAAPNAPYSNRKTQYELAADYRLSKGQNVRLSYERENIQRWCDSYAISGVNCLVNPKNDEDRYSIGYRLKAREDVNFNAGYTYANRRADSQGNAVTPLAGLDTLTPDDVNAQDYPGFVAYPYGSRKEHLVKAGVNWQATEKLDLGLNGRYVHDVYDETLGVQNSHTWGVNLDATYAYAEKGTISAYASWQESERELKSGAAGNGAVNAAESYGDLVAPTNIWTNTLDDKGEAIGLIAKHGGLMGGKLELIGDVSYSLDKSYYSTKVPFQANCGTPAVLTCGSTPDIKNRFITLKLTGNYQVNKNGKVAVGYLYSKLDSSDYYYNGLEYGYTPNRVMPTNEQAPDYSVNVLTASYIYSF